jgi:putative heme-binding domain-containing protein
MAESGLNPLPPSWTTALSTALTDPTHVALAAAVIRKLPAESAAPLAEALLHTAERNDLPAAARLDALLATPAAGAVSPDLFTFLLTQLQRNQPAQGRSLAADVLARSALSTEQLTTLTDLLRSAGPLEINKLLHAYAKSKDESLGLKLVAALKESKSLRSLRADVLKPRLNQFGPKVGAESQALLSKLDPDAAEQRSKLDHLLATLPTGDVRRGQAVFNNPKVSCVSCHAIGYLGGHVGPDLTKVGTIRSERDLLESIIYPSASFAQSFEPYIAITTTGQRYDGLLRRDDAEGIILVTGPDQEVKVPRAELKELRPGALSIMPAGLDQQLSPQELSDLLAFLKATNW